MYFMYSFFRCVSYGCDGDHLCVSHHDGHSAQFFLPRTHINPCPHLGSNVSIYLIRKTTYNTTIMICITLPGIHINVLYSYVLPTYLLFLWLWYRCKLLLNELLRLFTETFFICSLTYNASTKNGGQITFRLVHLYQYMYYFQNWCIFWEVILLIPKCWHKK